MKMNSEDEIALEESIALWKEMRDGAPRTDCPLCILAKRRQKASGMLDDFCQYCIISVHTGQSGCLGTPFHVDKKKANYHTLEITFLESLRPGKDELRTIEIEPGDTVTVTDSSWTIPILRGKREHVTSIVDIEFVVVYFMKKSVTTVSEERNDVLLFNPLNDEYLLAYGRRLEKVYKPKTLKCCTECGKEK